MSSANPRPLKDWLEQWSRQKVASGTPAEIVGPMLSFNQLVRQPWRDGEVDVLVVEQQGVWLWGQDLPGAFFERENEPERPWLATGESDEAFWLHQAAFEFISSRFPAYRSSNAAPRQLADLVLTATQPLPCGDWHWPGRRQRMRHRGDSLAMVCDDDDLFYVMVGGPDEAALAWADDLAITWDESDSRTTSDPTT